MDIIVDDIDDISKELNWKWVLKPDRFVMTYITYVSLDSNSISPSLNFRRYKVSTKVNVFNLAQCVRTAG